MFTYREHTPHRFLDPWVKCFWELSRDPGFADPPALERILPDGCMEWVFHLATPFRLLLTDTRLERQGHALLVGVTTRRVVLEPSHDADVVGVRFRPGGAGAFLTPPPAHFAERIAPLDEAEDRRLLELLDRLREARRGERIPILERELLTRASRIDAKSGSLVGAVESLLAGSASVERVAEDCGFGPRQLQRRFAAEVGVRPRELARIGRLQRAARLLTTNVPLVKVALDAGYADQSHFGREFLHFAGLSPAGFRREAHALAAAFAGGS